MTHEVNAREHSAATSSPLPDLKKNFLKECRIHGTLYPPFHFLLSPTHRGSTRITALIGSHIDTFGKSSKKKEKKTFACFLTLFHTYKKCSCQRDLSVAEKLPTAYSLGFMYSNSLKQAL